jgi:hypothetical protein
MSRWGGVSVSITYGRTQKILTAGVAESSQRTQRNYQYYLLFLRVLCNFFARTTVATAPDRLLRSKLIHYPTGRNRLREFCHGREKHHRGHWVSRKNTEKGYRHDQQLLCNIVFSRQIPVGFLSGTMGLSDAPGARRRKMKKPRG